MFVRVECSPYTRFVLSKRLSVRVLLDNSIPGHSQLCDWAMGPQGPLVGPYNQDDRVLGITRKRPHNDMAFQAQVDLLFTVGRLIREKHIEAFTYSEFLCESMEQFSGDPMLDALAECDIRTCPPAIDRSRFQRGDYFEFARKGGKKDRKRGIESSLSQIAFMQMLCELTDELSAQLITFKGLLGLTDFEIESLKNLKCYQQLCRISNSIENYPDMFHLWTAHRNRIDALLTLDNKFVNIANKLCNSRGALVEFPTMVLRPSELLSFLGIKEPDTIPIQYGRFYTLVELWRDAPTEKFALFRVRQR